MFKRAKLVEAIDASRRFIGIAEKAVAELDDWSGRDELSVPSSSKIFASVEDAVAGKVVTVATV